MKKKSSPSRSLLPSTAVGLLLSLAFLPLLPAQTTVPATGVTTATSGFKQLKAGDAAPDFTVTGAKGETIKLSDFRGKILIVDVSATWCGPCQAAMPNNDRIYQKYAAQGVVLLGVTADDTREAYDGWVKRNDTKYKFRMTFDPAGKDGWEKSVFNTDYHVTGFPMMFVVGRDGKISETVSGGGPGEDYRLEYALARAGAKVDLASIPAEAKKDPNAPKSVPMVAKTPAMPASTAMIGMGAAAPAGGGFTPEKFGSVARGAEVDFTLTGIDGQPVKLSSFRGKTLLLQFATSNGPQPWFKKIADTYKDQGVTALAVFSATEREAFDQWVAANPKPGFAVAWDSAGKAWAENVTNTIFGVGMYPATALINAEGKLWSGTIGMGDKVIAMVYSMLARNGVKLTPEHMNALVAAGGAIGAAGGAPAPTATAAVTPAVAAKSTLLAAGTIAPDFMMHDVNDKEVHLSDFKGKVVILDFWATWCGPCISSFPHTQKLAEKYAGQDVVVLASGTSDTIEAFKKWIPLNQPKYPNMRFVFDLNERDSPTFDKRASASLFGVTGIPTQYVVGRDGKVVASIVGNGGEGDLRTEGALAAAGVKVDPAIAAKAKEALVAAALEEDRRVSASATAAARPPFMENYGKLVAGEAVPEMEVQNAAGQNVTLSSLTKGKITILAVWSARGVAAEVVKQLEHYATKYADQGLTVVGLAAYAGRGDFDTMLKMQEGNHTFPFLFDPAGDAPKPAKAPADMTVDEKKEFSTVQREHFAKVAPMKFTGGVMAPVPNFTVIDAQGHMVGLGVGSGPGTVESVGNLLLRAGVKLAAEDMPKRVWTAEETKPAAPVAKVEMLKVGAAAPDFAATDIDGKPVKISDFRGKVVILDFWATWCGPCITSMPHTNEVAAHYKDQGVVVIASCTSDTRAMFDSWVKKNQSTFPEMKFSFDPQERKPERASAKLYGVGGIPQQFIIGRDGKIAALCTGYLKGEVLLEAALAQAGVKVAPEIIVQAKRDQANRDAMR